MIKHVPEDLSVVFSEIPGEISLAFNISRCQCGCIGCHSPYLREDIGEELTSDVMKSYIDKNSGVSCICFMGEGNDQSSIINLVEFIRSNFPDLKVAIYSGREEVEPEFMEIFDYVKVGPYRKEFGPLNFKTTNQRLYKKEDGEFKDITYKFWRNV